ncbi:helix-turn-helix transcriptional regulator [Sinimarinibacterium flocculans]|uniref:DNA-binding XRE family transcriptional regulator n=1 Tax=Sinimarinibacterium flocculans TaxID=985250 RepID=A0A318EGB6_9GAMM|nr:helix-turn-helix transcriptional regulator [Sinimarinibacterium flocculans]PXV67249.1 DNA-binding XRE family transcriptional regulator [Sinimarinibacterium flocculans]HBG31529.1 hypothetical protein [Gammaproteobacteria bacterium]
MEQHDYAKAFRIIRAAFGLKQSELAKRMRVSTSQLSLIEAGKRQPSLRVINGLAGAVGVPAAMVTVLASTSRAIESEDDRNVTDLARTLLRLLVSATPDAPRQLALDA